ncbi:Hypothetical predicted protein [Octopus vulgaris]|uniref:Short-chain collagen C4-like n=1 Tax=Octopus vulgaris TaxID=6645 RepID=A0AA36BNE8_OCTVU|nr:Hypothetical predicted protein [Octopus vulgaris]
MDFAQLSRNISQRYSISSLIAFGVLLVLTIVILHQDSRIGKMEEKSKTNRFISKKSLDDKPDVTPSVAGGEWYDNPGGGSNLLCLPNDPIWANYTAKVEDGGWIHGSEYQLDLYPTNKLFSFANAESIHDHNVPCAVCLTQQPAVVMMLPARTQCYEGWATEYSGYLMSSHHQKKGRLEYVCVDHAPEADPAGYRNEDGAILYFVQASCGSLPCPPSNTIISFINAKSHHDHNILCDVCFIREPAVVMKLHWLDNKVFSLIGVTLNSNSGKVRKELEGEEEDAEEEGE